MPYGKLAEHPQRLARRRAELATVDAYKDERLRLEKEIERLRDEDHELADEANRKHRVVDVRPILQRCPTPTTPRPTPIRPRPMPTRRLRTGIRRRRTRPHPCGHGPAPIRPGSRFRPPARAAAGQRGRGDRVPGSRDQRQAETTIGCPQRERTSPRSAALPLPGNQIGYRRSGPAKGRMTAGPHHRPAARRTRRPRPVPFVTYGLNNELEGDLDAGRRRLEWLWVARARAPRRPRRLVDPSRR